MGGSWPELGSCKPNTTNPTAYYYVNVDDRALVDVNVEVNDDTCFVINLYHARYLKESWHK